MWAVFLDVKIPVRRAASHVGVPGACVGSTLNSNFLLTQPRMQPGLFQVVESLTHAWAIRTEFQDLDFSLAQPQPL